MHLVRLHSFSVMILGVLSTVANVGIDEVAGLVELSLNQLGIYHL